MLAHRGDTCVECECKGGGVYGGQTGKVYPIGYLSQCVVGECWLCRGKIIIFSSYMRSGQGGVKGSQARGVIWWVVTVICSMCRRMCLKLKLRVGNGGGSSVGG